MLLDFFDDVFLLHLALETTQGILKRLILLNDYFSQFTSPHSQLELLLLVNAGSGNTIPGPVSHEVAGFL